jgi:hypothetical protein
MMSVPPPTSLTTVYGAHWTAAHPTRDPGACALNAPLVYCCSSCMYVCCLCCSVISVSAGVWVSMAWNILRIS